MDSPRPGGAPAAGARRRWRALALQQPGAAASLRRTRGDGTRVGPHHHSRCRRHPDHQGRLAARCDVRPGLRPRPGPPVAARYPQAHRLRSPGRGLRRRGCRERSLPARAGSPPHGAEAVGRHPGSSPRTAAGICSRHQCLRARAHVGAASRVRLAGARARAMGAGGQHGLDDHDGLGPRSQLEQRAAAHASRIAHADEPHQRTAAPVPRREADGTGRLSGAVSRTAGGWPPGQPRAGRRSHVGHGRRGLEQLGPRRVADRKRQAAAGQRSAPQAQRARPVVLRATGSAGLQGGGRHHARAADRGAGAERAARLGLHQHQPRRAGPLPRADQARRPDALPHARRMGAVRDLRGSDPRAWPARREDDGARDPPRPGAARRRGRPRCRPHGTAGRTALCHCHAVDRPRCSQHHCRCRPRAQSRGFGGRVHRRIVALHGSDAEHGGGRSGRAHRHGGGRQGADAPSRQRPQGTGARTRLGGPLRLVRLSRRRSSRRARSIPRAAGSPRPTSASIRRPTRTT